MKRLIASTALAIVALAAVASAQWPRLRPPDVKFVATPQNVVDAMLALARVTPSDVVYDLGSGDGRIPITAAKTYGARGVGIEIDPLRIRQAMDNLAKAGVGDRVQFVNTDLFEADISGATVVTLFLLPHLNQKLMPKLRRELRPGARVVSHEFDMGPEWPPERSEDVDGLMIYLWTIVDSRESAFPWSNFSASWPARSPRWRTCRRWCGRGGRARRATCRWAGC